MFGFPDSGKQAAMPLDDAGKALNAKIAQALRHAEQQREEARVQRARAHEVREVEAAAVEAARRREVIDAEYVQCTHCRAIWLTEEVRQSTRRRFGCLLCGGRLTPLP